MIRFSLKLVGLYIIGVLLKFSRRMNLFVAMMMTTGLTFDTIVALYGLEHGIIDKNQYSILEAVVLLSAIIPTFIAQKFLFPREGDNV